MYLIVDTRYGSSRFIKILVEAVLVMLKFLGEVIDEWLLTYLGRLPWQSFSSKIPLVW